MAPKPLSIQMVAYSPRGQVIQEIRANNVSQPTITVGLQGGLEGTFGAALLYGIGSHFAKGAGAKGSGFLGSGLKAGRFAQKVLTHAAAGGVLSVLQGGKFGHGFVSAGFAEAGASTIDGNLHSSFAKVAASAMVGGSVSYLAGGKFGNGAATGAMQMAFNQLAHGRTGGNESEGINSICDATYDEFDQKLGDLSLTPEYSLDFSEKVSSHEGPYALSMSELKSVMDKDMAFLNIRLAKLGGAMNFGALEFNCFSYAFGDGTFRERRDTHPSDKSDPRLRPISFSRNASKPKLRP